jgi:hypothetical protein
LNDGLIPAKDGNLVFHFPSSNFHASVDINSQHWIGPHSLEANIGLESVNLTVHLVQELISRLKPRESTKSLLPLAPQPIPHAPTTPSMFSPISPSLPFMVGHRFFVNTPRSHVHPVIASRAHRKEGTQEIISRRTLFFLPTQPPILIDLARLCYPQSSS